MENELWLTCQHNFAAQYRAKATQQQTLQAKAAALQQELDQTRLQLTQNNELHVSWIEGLVLPVMLQLQAQLPGWHLIMEELVAARGLLRNGVLTVFLYKNPALPMAERLSEANSIFISWRAGDLRKGELLFDRADLYASPPAKDDFTVLEHVEQALFFLRKQIDRSRRARFNS